MKKWIVILVLLLSAVNSWCWWDQSTHKTLTKNAAKRYFTQINEPDYLDKEFSLDGKKQAAEFWLQDGSELEDESNLLGIPTRSLNHFHNPTKPLATAGLDDTFSGMSALIWAQAPSGQTNVTGGNWTWQKVREHQYSYLTALDQTSHDANQARMLKGLGYQMHLVQDMSQPNHVRNDIMEASI